jgi:hypothetical protein
MSTTKTHPCLVDCSTGRLVGCGTIRPEGMVVGWDTSGNVLLQSREFVGSPLRFRAETLGLRIGETL